MVYKKLSSQVEKNLTYRNVIMVVGGLLALYGLYSLVYGEGKTECPPSTVYTPTKVESRTVEKTTYTTNHHKANSSDNQEVSANA